MEKERLGAVIKNQLLKLHIKTPCCRSSFIAGTEVFAKNRRNEFTEAIAQYKAKLTSGKKRSFIDDEFFDETRDSGYYAATENGERYPASHGRLCPNCHASLLRGAFLVCGRASVSVDGYHVELPMPSERALDVVAEGLARIGIEPKTSVRRGELLLYCKKRESVTYMMAYIGASAVALKISAEGVEKEMRAEANRQKNCDTTNILRSISAAERQLAAIKAIIEHGALGKLPNNLKETAIIRYENQIESLDEITELHGGTISKSGVNHRLAKIIEFAEKNGYLIK